MMKRVISVVLTLALLLAIVPTAFAAQTEQGWKVFAYGPDDVIEFYAVAPARYVRAAEPLTVEVLWISKTNPRQTLTATLEERPFRFDGKTENHLVLVGSVEIPDLEEYEMAVIIPAGTVFDASGAANARAEVRADDFEADYVMIDAYSRLLLREYSWMEETIAVGDTVTVTYCSVRPAQVLVNGVVAAELAAGEKQTFRYTVENTGSLTFEVVGRTETERRAFTVISSEEMYQRNLEEMRPEGPSTDPGDHDLTGFPIGNPFLPLGFLAVFFAQIAEFFHRVLSYFRIAR